MAEKTHGSYPVFLLFISRSKMYARHGRIGRAREPDWLTLESLLSSFSVRTSPRMPRRFSKMLKIWHRRYGTYSYNTCYRCCALQGTRYFITVPGSALGGGAVIRSTRYQVLYQVPCVLYFTVPGTVECTVLQCRSTVLYKHT